MKKNSKPVRDTLLRLFRSARAAEQRHPEFSALLFLAVAISLIAAPYVAVASQVTAVITGTVFSSGTDFNGVTFSSTGTSTDLTNDSFTLTYLADDTKGTPGFYMSGTTTTGSYIENNGLNNPISAVLTINGHSVNMGTFGPVSAMTSYIERYASTAAGGDQFYFSLAPTYSTLDSTGSSYVNATIITTGLTTDINWQDALSWSK